MKRILYFLVLLPLLCSSFALAEVRLDLGFDVPFGFAGITSNGVANTEISTFFQQHIIPFPEAGVYYVLKTGPARFGFGLRAFTFIIESVAWPNIFAEVEWGPAVLEAQVGGGAFVLFGLLNRVETGKVFFPDISLWFKLGKTFRLGGGVMGLFIDQFASNTIPVVAYLGLKAAIKFE